MFKRGIGARSIGSFMTTGARTNRLERKKWLIVGQMQSIGSPTMYRCCTHSATPCPPPVGQSHATRCGCETKPATSNRSLQPQSHRTNPANERERINCQINTSTNEKCSDISRCAKRAQRKEFFSSITDVMSCASKRAIACYGNEWKPAADQRRWLLPRRFLSNRCWIAAQSTRSSPLCVRAVVRDAGDRSHRSANEALCGKQWIRTLKKFRFFGSVVLPCKRVVLNMSSSTNLDR